jgi:hypothetical protein
MALAARIYEGSGKAECRLCHKVIKKGQKQITMYGYQTQGSVHGERRQCKITRKESNV